MVPVLPAVVPAAGSSDRRPWSAVGLDLDFELELVWQRSCNLTSRSREQPIVRYLHSQSAEEACGIVVNCRNVTYNSIRRSQ